LGKNQNDGVEPCPGSVNLSERSFRYAFQESAIPLGNPKIGAKKEEAEFQYLLKGIKKSISKILKLVTCSLMWSFLGKKTHSFFIFFCNNSANCQVL